jgi:hypothetical protein
VLGPTRREGGASAPRFLVVAHATNRLRFTLYDRKSVNKTMIYQEDELGIICRGARRKGRLALTGEGFLTPPSHKDEGTDHEQYRRTDQE